MIGTNNFLKTKTDSVFFSEEEETLFRDYAYHDWNLEGTTDPWALSRVRRQQDSFPSVRVSFFGSVATLQDL